MKHMFLFLFASIIFSFSIQAQITVTGSSVAPFGSSWIYHADAGYAPVQIPPGGPNQVWIEPTHSFGYHFQTDFQSPVGTPYDTAFPGATHCVFNTVNYGYLQLTNNELLQLGAASGSSILHYNPTSLIMPIPLTYPHSPWTRVFQYSFQVIQGYIATVRDSSIITLDGWGSLTTQFGTFQVLRTQERHWITERLNGVITANKKNVSYAWFDQRGVTILSYTNNSDSTNFTTASIVEAEFNPTSINQESNFVPDHIILDQNYPNPFNPNTVISYQLPVSGDVKLNVFDMLGNEIATLVDEYKPAGSYKVDFKSTVVSHQLASGVYFYKLKAGPFAETKKMILMK